MIESGSFRARTRAVAVLKGPAAVPTGLQTLANFSRPGVSPRLSINTIETSPVEAAWVYWVMIYIGHRPSDVTSDLTVENGVRREHT